MAHMFLLNPCMFTLCVNLISIASWQIYQPTREKKCPMMHSCQGVSSCNEESTRHSWVSCWLNLFCQHYTCDVRATVHLTGKAFLSSPMMSFHCWQVSLIIPSIWLPRAMLTAAQKPCSHNFPPKTEVVFHKFWITLLAIQFDS